MSEDIRSCDQEPIHLIQSIQSHGCLIAFDWPDRRVHIISQNAPEMMGLTEREMMGMRLDHLFETEVIQKITQVIKDKPWDLPGRHLDVRPLIKEKCFDAYMYESEGFYFIELEQIHAEKTSNEVEIETEQILREYIFQAKNLKTIPELSKLVCSTIRKITGLDRVMMYRFLPPTWHGIVIGEDRVTHAHSYMNHRFPASDIPVPARELYLRNQVRLIPDVVAPVSPLVPQIHPLTKKPVNLKDSRLRAVAPIHLEYLRNMKVGASFSVAVTSEEKLWALIACHHMTPMMISQSARTACEIIAHSFSVQAPAIEILSEQRDRLDFEIKSKRVLESLRSSPEPMSDFFKHHRTVAEAFDAGGMALVSDKLQDFAGLTPLKGDIEELAPWIRARMNDENKDFIAVENLSQIDPKWSRVKEFASGLLAAKIPDRHDSILIFFRPEVLTTITWGGDPHKQLGKRDFQGKINPRLSFEAWEETLTRHAKPWKKFEIDGLLFLRDFVFDGLAKKERLIRELSQDLRKDSQIHR